MSKQFDDFKKFTLMNETPSAPASYETNIDLNKIVCMFEPRTDTTSATICKHCGQEKFIHNQVPEVRKMVEITFLEIGRKRWEDWLEFNKKACYPDEYQSAYADGFTRGAKWMQEQLKQPK